MDTSVVVLVHEFSRKRMKLICCEIASSGYQNGSIFQAQVSRTSHKK